MVRVWTELGTMREWVTRYPLVTAFSLSLMVHLACFGWYKMGERLGWWKYQATWLLDITKSKKKDLAKQLNNLRPRVPVQARQEIPLTFVQVDPTIAVTEAPKEAKFYGAHSSKAANPEPAIDTTTPKIDGRQDKVAKVEDVPKTGPQPLQPSLPPPDAGRPKQDPGDTLKKAEGTAEMGSASKERPRTLAMARQQKNLIVGEKMRQDGGVSRRGKISLDVVGSPFGAYDAYIIAAIQQRWYDLIDSSQITPRSGKVMLEFRLNYDGRITDMNMKANEVGDLLALLCQRAIMDPSPYAKWPEDMRRMVGKNFREVLFTFYYE